MSRAAASRRRAAHRKTQRRKKQESELARLESGGKHRPWWKIRGKGPETKLHKRRVESLKSKLGKPKSNQTAKDKDDARKESELASVLANKGKTRKDPGPGKDASGKKRTATLKEDQAKNAPKKKEALKTTKGKGPVASGEEYGKHLKEQSKKYKTKGKGPVKSGKEYGKTVKEHAAKKEADERSKWLKKTRNSPAAKHFSDDERWALQKRHREWKASRKKKK